MCTLMQKDALIELVAYLRAFFISKDVSSSNISERAPEQDELLEIRQYLYRTSHDMIDFNALRNRLFEIQEQFNITL